VLGAAGATAHATHATSAAATASAVLTSRAPAAGSGRRSE
jgi:hypothetical protein